MLSFLKHTPDRQPVKTINRLNNIRFTLEDNLKRITQFWHGANWSVKGDHILVSMLGAMTSEAFNAIDVYDSVRYQAQRVSMARGFASQVGYGRIQPKSYFYGNDCQEIYVYQNFDDSIKQIFTKHYTSWETIRIISHPFTSLDFQLANGKPRKSGEKGLVVIKMDLALMYAQYRMWRADRYRSYYLDGTPKSITNFIHTYPIVSMLKSHTDQAWFNRLFKLSKGEELSNIREDSRLFLVNPYYNVDQVLERIMEDCEKSRNNIHEWCSEIPGIFCKNLKAFYTQDNVLETQQLKGPWNIGRLPLYEWLFSTALKSKGGSNTLYVGEYRKQMREYTNQRTFDTIRGVNGKDVLQEFDTRVTSYVDLL